MTSMRRQHYLTTKVKASSTSTRTRQLKEEDPRTWRRETSPRASQNLSRGRSLDKPLRELFHIVEVIQTNHKQKHPVKSVGLSWIIQLKYCIAICGRSQVLLGNNKNILSTDNWCQHITISIRLSPYRTKSLTPAPAKSTQQWMSLSPRRSLSSRSSRTSETSYPT